MTDDVGGDILHLGISESEQEAYQSYLGAGGDRTLTSWVIDFRNFIQDSVVKAAKKSAYQEAIKKFKNGSFPFNKIKHPPKKRFLVAYVVTGTVISAEDHSGVSRASHYLWMNEDKDYREAFTDARIYANDLLESEAFRRAYDGVHEDIFYLGRVVGQKRNYSDGLMKTLLQANNPSRFSQKTEVGNPGDFEPPESTGDRRKRLIEEANERLASLVAEEVP